MPIVLLVEPGAQVEAPEAGPGLLEVIQRLRGAGDTEIELMRLVLEREGYDGLPRLFAFLSALAGRQILRHEVRSADGSAVATALPLGAMSHRSGEPFVAARRVTLSRFAYLRKRGNAMALESPLANATIVLHDERGAAMVAALAIGLEREEGTEWAASLEELLWNANMLSAAGETSALDEQHDPALIAWEFHDLLFHARSRAGRHPYPSGRTKPLQGVIDALPAIKARMSDDVVPLGRVDLDKVMANDPAFTRVLESRRSVREHAADAITLDAVGEFLFRVARVKEENRRVYPGGGAAYELEFYLTVRVCAGLAPGLYHYEPQDHALCRLPALEDDVAALLEGAAVASASGRPHILIVIAARIPRVTWTYSSVAYALILKDVGVVYQTMNLVATAMGLAGCALGGGNADLFARASGLDYYLETSVGEFMLGAGRG